MSFLGFFSKLCGRIRLLASHSYKLSVKRKAPGRKARRSLSNDIAFDQLRTDGVSTGSP